MASGLWQSFPVAAVLPLLLCDPIEFPQVWPTKHAIWGRVTFPVYVSKYLSGCEIDQTSIKINFYRVTDYSPPGGTSDSLFILGPETWLEP